MGLAPNAAAVGLAFAGTLVVYNVDRLRNVASDRATAPRRSAFVAAHRLCLGRLTADAGLAPAPFRPSERYGLWVVDGALLAGAAAAAAWAAP